jgi:hypothetical protein
MGWMVESVFDSRQEHRLLPAPSHHRQVLGPIQWALVDLSPGVKWILHEDDHLPVPSSKVRSVCGAIHVLSHMWCLILHKLFGSVW